MITNGRCTYEFESDYLDSKLDGVLGLQYVKDVSLPAQFTRKNGIRDIFGHCIAPKEPNGDMSGYLIFGYHALTMSQKITWVPIFVATPPSRYLISSYQTIESTTQMSFHHYMWESSKVSSHFGGQLRVILRLSI